MQPRILRNFRPFPNFLRRRPGPKRFPRSPARPCFSSCQPAKAADRRLPDAKGVKRHCGSDADGPRAEDDGLFSLPWQGAPCGTGVHGKGPDHAGRLIGYGRHPVGGALRLCLRDQNVLGKGAQGPGTGGVFPGRERIGIHPLSDLEVRGPHPAPHRRNLRYRLMAELSAHRDPSGPFRKTPASVPQMLLLRF